MLIGHVELKAPGAGAKPKSFTSKHDKEQFKKLGDHPNLIYTDGNEWALYRLGELVDSVVSSTGDVTADGAAAFGPEDALLLEQLLRDFFSWEPIVPKTPRALAELLAPLTRLLRENVRTALSDPASALSTLAKEWRDVFFPDADDAQFADAYAQTVTYALLLARVEGEDDLRFHAADRLDARHELLAQVLRVLEQQDARKEVETGVALLERAIAAVDPEALATGAKEKDLWLYFYEDFLAAYDPKLRRQSGVYFTPAEVVKAQATLVTELLRTRFGKNLGFADDDVTVLDPAVGTGTYLLAAFQHGLELVGAEYGSGQKAARATVMARNFHGFERLIGAYAVAHLRLAREILDAGGTLPASGVPIYLTDTLESPHAAPQGYATVPLFEKKLAAENARARRVKTDLPVLVCLGNPPYFRETIDPGEEGVERQGRWIKEGDEGEEHGILHEFVKGTPGVHVKNLYNLYVYFWRWALWKVFELGSGQGIVSFITASSYLRGPGFAGMRRHMRETFDELWILDLGGEGRGARRSDNVFAIQTPVAIAIGIRNDARDEGSPAVVRYARVEGDQRTKLETLAAVTGFGTIQWQECYSGWEEPLLPESAADFFAWPALTDLFPWQHSGSQFKRTWPIAPERATLERRWHALANADSNHRPALFRETRDRKSPTTAALPAGTPSPPSVRYAYRSFDRQFALVDERLGDFLRPVLWMSQSAQQLF
ncbi:MAG: type ISP restriction/modification enzyme, partial [Gaiellaceae bacterium]